MKRKLKRFSLKFLWPLIPTLILLSLAYSLSQLKTFQIKKISCQFNHHPCSLKFEPLLVNLYGQNIFKLDKKNLKNQIQNFDSTLTEIKVQKNLPNSISIAMIKRQSIAQINPVIDLEFTDLSSTQSATMSGILESQFFNLDKSGEIFEKTTQRTSDLPLVFIKNDHDFNLGSTSLTRTIADLVDQLEQHFVNFESIIVLSDFFIIKTNLGSNAIFSTTKSLQAQVASLQYILTNIKIDQSLPTKIDLRFDKPILTY